MTPLKALAAIRTLVGNHRIPDRMDLTSNTVRRCLRAPTSGTAVRQMLEKPRNGGLRGKAVIRLWDRHLDPGECGWVRRAQGQARACS